MPVPSSADRQRRDHYLTLGSVSTLVRCTPKRGRLHMFSMCPNYALASS